MVCYRCGVPVVSTCKHVWYSVTELGTEIPRENQFCSLCHIPRGRAEEECGHSWRKSSIHGNPNRRVCADCGDLAPIFARSHGTHNAIIHNGKCICEQCCIDMPEEETTPTLNNTTCVKCGDEGPHTMKYGDNHSPILNTNYRTAVLPEFEEHLAVTCRKCGHGFGTMPCKDAKEDV